MNEKNVTFLIKQIRNRLDELESEIHNDSKTFEPTPDMYDEVVKYNNWNISDDEWTD
jgi:hypothetical protein